jgi:non-heme chloroperoxidase
MPVRILYGSRDAVFPRDQQDELLAALPNAALSVYEETGHSLHWEQPGRFARELECFVEDAHLARDARAA